MSLMRAFSIQKPAGAQSQSLSTRRPEDPSRSPGSSNTTSSDDRSRGLQEDLENNNNNNNENWILNHQREQTQQRQLEVVFFNDNEVSERGRQGFGAGRRAGEFLVGLGTAALIGGVAGTAAAVVARRRAEGGAAAAGTAATFPSSVCFLCTPAVLTNTNAGST